MTLILFILATSALIFIAGLLCHHCMNERQHRLALHERCEELLREAQKELT
jgi:cell division protein ZapA (FtsZ GTPase activity inhibitor)